MRKFNRRWALRGIGGAILGLPLLESLGPRPLNAQSAGADPFVIFFRQPCGVAARQSTAVGEEVERFWPRARGALTPENVEGRALDELSAHLDKLLVVGNVNYYCYDNAFADGHATGALQALTSRGPAPGTSGGESEAGGESIDHHLARELTPGEDPLFLYAGESASYAWLGGPCVSHRGAAVRQPAERSPLRAFERIFGVAQEPGADAQTAARRVRVNDLVRDQMQSLMRQPRMSRSDRARLQDHFDAIRDVESAVSCEAVEAERAAVEVGSAGFDNPTGSDLVTTVQNHLRVAALAAACGRSRAIVVQVGSGNGAALRFNDPDSGALLENFHFLSHRRASHDSNGAVITDSDILHHKVDRHFGRLFAGLLDTLSASGILDDGLAVWFNDNANGPQHATANVPWVIGGSAGGALKQGEYVDAIEGQFNPCVDRVENVSLRRLHHTLAGALLGREDRSFGDPEMPAGALDALTT